LAGGNRVTTGRQVPFCMFTDPELARIGLSETEAKQRGIPYRVAKLPMAAVLRAMTISETRGFMKVLIETESDRMLGFTMFGAGAGDVMAAVQMAMLGGLPYTAVRDAVIAHPTMPEGLESLFGNVPPISAQMPKVRDIAEGSSPEIRINTAALEQVGIGRRAVPHSSIS
jgi:pyruvate/2-oxoglutarate dehydrogenase complex dihydrolipoamide dehydrogenase (E3) component